MRWRLGLLIVLLAGSGATAVWWWTRPPSGSWGELAPRARRTSREPVPDFTFAIVSDLHFGKQRDHEASRLVRTIPRVSGAPVRGGPPLGTAAFVLTCGDNIENGEEADAAAQFRTFQAAMNGIGVPYYYANGNHDVLGPKDAPRAQRREPWSEGRLHFALERHGVHFLVLNYYPDDNGNYPEARLGVSQRRWLHARLLEIGLSRPIVIIMHPLPRRWPWLKMPTWIALNADEEAFLADTLRGFNVLAIVCGHYHGHHVERWDGHTVICVGSWVHGSPYVLGARFRNDTFEVYRWHVDELEPTSRRPGTPLLTRPVGQSK